MKWKLQLVGTVNVRLDVRLIIVRGDLLCSSEGILYDLPVTLDSTFDAGGKISSGLIIVNTMCQR